MKKRLFALILGFLLVHFFALTSWAGIRIDKPKIRVSAKPGSYDSGEIEVENIGAEAASIKVYLEDWVYSQQDGVKEFMPKATTPLSCANWINFYPADFTLSPGREQIVRYTVNIPDDAKGGHVAVMFFETGGDNIAGVNDQGNSVIVKVTNRLGALFYAEPAGTIQKTGQLKDLDIMQKLDNIIVSANFINTGNTDIAVSGTFNIIDDQGLVYARGQFDDAYTLPKDKISLRAVAPSTNLKSGAYDLLLTLEFQNGGTLVQEAHFTVASSGAIEAVTIKN